LGVDVGVGVPSGLAPGDIILRVSTNIGLVEVPDGVCGAEELYLKMLRKPTRGVLVRLAGRAGGLFGAVDDEERGDDTPGDV
jgi:hypothetical protein